MNIPEHRRFENLSSLISHLKDNYPDKKVSIEAKDINSSNTRKLNVPKYLFRGEPGLYDSSLTSMQRMKTESDLDEIDKTILEAISIYVDEKIQKKLNVSGMDSAAYVQHYGLYSELLDFTVDLDICAWFATELDSNDNSGRICVLDVETAKDNSILIDLSLHPFASRARLQKAYGVYSKVGSNFKSDLIINDLGLVWYEFQRNDLSRQIQEKDYYKTSNDKFSGFIALAIDDCIYENGQITDSSAKLLSNRITRTPIFSVTNDIEKIDFDKLNAGFSAEEIGLSNCEWEIKAAEELRCEIDLDFERNYSYSKWSQLIPHKLDLIDYEIDESMFAIRILTTKTMTNLIFE